MFYITIIVERTFFIVSGKKSTENESIFKCVPWEILCQNLKIEKKV